MTQNSEVKLSIYQQIKNAKNASERTQNFYKKHVNRSVWAMGKEGESLKSVIKKGLKNTLILGSPGSEHSPDQNRSEKYVQSRSFIGRYFSDVYCGTGRGDINLVGLGKEGKGLWFVDVTELFIEKYNKMGRCALHDSGHLLKLVSPRLKQCKFCECFFEKKIVVKKRIEWNKK